MTLRKMKRRMVTRPKRLTMLKICQQHLSLSKRIGKVMIKQRSLSKILNNSSSRLVRLVNYQSLLLMITSSKKYWTERLEVKNNCQKLILREVKNNFLVLIVVAWVVNLHTREANLMVVRSGSILSIQVLQPLSTQQRILWSKSLKSSKMNVLLLD